MSALSKHRAEVEFFREHPGEAFDEQAQVEFQIEHWLDILDELKPLILEHWSELKEDVDIPLNFDWDRYAQLDQLGKLHVVTARINGWLIGYDTGVLLDDHLHHKGTLVCCTDITWMRPEYRKGMTGYKMMKFFRDTLIARGVKKIFFACTTKRNIDVLFRRLGYKQRFVNYTLVLP